MESPAKKLDFSTANKENLPADQSAPETEVDTQKPAVDLSKKDEHILPPVAPTIKAEEADEPLLQENPQRFVLFPIKYHEVCCVTRFLRVKWPTTAKTRKLTRSLDLANVQEG